MELNKFSSFILKNANENDAIRFVEDLGVGGENIHVFNKLSIDNVRDIKSKAEIIHERREAFIFGDIGFDAQNALLKTIEEPPDNTIFVFYKPDNLLDTIYSRCQIIRFKKEPAYLKSEIVESIEDNSPDLLGHLLTFENSKKDEIIALLNGLIFYLSERKKIKALDRIKEFAVTFSEFNLNKRLLLVNIYLALRGENEDSYC